MEVRLEDMLMLIKRRQFWEMTFIPNSAAKTYRNSNCKVLLALTRGNWVNYSVILMSAQLNFNLPGEKGKQRNPP